MVVVVAAIDTNIFISAINKESGYQRSIKPLLDWIDEGKIKAIVSTTVLAEICSGYEIAQKDSREKDEFLAHVLSSSNYEIAVITVPVALDAGNLCANKGLKLPDPLIVASALRDGAEFLISNYEPVGKARTLPLDLKVLSASEFVKTFEERSATNRKESKIKK